MKEYKTDIAVALIFFNRPNCLKEVFRAVSEQRPSRLYLIQDGPRENKPNDKAKVEECRKIVSTIDWECEIIEDYSPVNLGCGRRIFSGLSNVFQKEEYAVIIEDDIVIGESFLPFCKKMCEKYKFDERIQMVSGMNQLGVYENCPNSYFFSRGGGAIWGWATWARCWNELDWNLAIASDQYVINCLDSQTWQNEFGKVLSTKAVTLRNVIERGDSPSYWSFHFGFYGAINNRINIVPKMNLISNIGLSEESAHTVSSLNELPDRLKKLYYAPIFDLPEVLQEPICVIDDQNYLRLQNEILCPTKRVLLKERFNRVLKHFGLHRR